MKRKRGDIGDWALGRGGCKSLLAVGCLALAAQTHAALADITNSAVATATYAGDTYQSEPSIANVPVAAANPALSVTKTASPDSNVAAGQTVTYTYVVTNTGNQTLTGIAPVDAHGGSGPPPVPASPALTDNGTLGDSPDSNIDPLIWGTLAPGDVVTFTATYVVTQSDVDTLQ